MQITKNSVVSFHYRLTDSDQALIEDSHASSPLVYLHGHEGIFPGLESALEGKTVGEKISVTLPPEETYGPRLDDAIQRVSINHVVNKSKKKIKYKPGMAIQLNTKNGAQSVIVVKAGLKSLDVDINHPLAGKTLNFDVEIVDIREASEEEIAHKHVHGEGGHHH